jgi:hypothetical protein
MSQEREQFMQGRRISWWFLALAPVLAFLGLEAWLLADGYNGHCGLLDAGWECSKVEYIWSSLLSPLLLPVFFIYACCWLLAVGLIALIVKAFHRRRRAAT